MLKERIRVTSIQRLCVNDGPGIRTVVFLKGCYLKCPWCCNPESIHYNRDLYFNKGKCTLFQFSKFCKECKLKGGNNELEKCLFNSFEKTYRDYTFEELSELLLRDESIYKEGGGVTFSGGEPLLQASQLKTLLQFLKRKNIHIALETTLYADNNNYQEIKEYIDYWLVDVKFQKGYFPNKDYSISINSFMKNLYDLQQTIDKSFIRYRMVIMNEIMDKLPRLIYLLKEFNIKEVELLGYHNLAETKYIQLSRQMTKYTPILPENLKVINEYMNLAGIKFTFLTI